MKVIKLFVKWITVVVVSGICGLISSIVGVLVLMWMAGASDYAFLGKKMTGKGDYYISRERFSNHDIYILETRDQPDDHGREGITEIDLTSDPHIMYFRHGSSSDIYEIDARDPSKDRFEVERESNRQESDLKLRRVEEVFDELK